jgi:hypothetical protein
LGGGGGSKAVGVFEAWRRAGRRSRGRRRVGVAVRGSGGVGDCYLYALSGDFVFVGAATEDVWGGEEEQPQHGFLRRRKRRGRKEGRKKEEGEGGILEGSW